MELNQEKLFQSEEREQNLANEIKSLFQLERSLRDQLNINNEQSRRELLIEFETLKYDYAKIVELNTNLNNQIQYLQNNLIEVQKHVMANGNNNELEIINLKIDEICKQNNALTNTIEKKKSLIQRLRVEVESLSEKQDKKNQELVKVYQKRNLLQKIHENTVNISTENEISEKLGNHLQEILLKLMDTSQTIKIGLSGGPLIDLLASIMPRLLLPWTCLRFFFVDERFVPFTSDESIYRNYQTKLFQQLSIKEENIMKIDANLKSIEECAQDYQTKLQELLTEQNKSFDIILLGMGPDGHTANLFPSHSALETNEGLVTFVKGSPSPPSERVTLTLNAINQAKYKIAVVTGENKSKIVEEVIHGTNKNYPIGQVENLIWYLDKAAASKL